MGIGDLNGSGVVVTGGGGHLGAAMALAAARAGAHVVVCGRTEETLQNVVRKASQAEVRGSVHYEVADVASEVDVQRVIARVEAVAGNLYGWVNNAFSPSGGLLNNLTREQVSVSVSSLTDVIVLTSAAADRMTASGGGVIVNVASMYGVVSPDPRTYMNYPQFHNPPAYGAVKAGIIQFTRYAAVHLAARNIRVNCISPGAIPGDIPQQHPGFVAELAKRIPMQRIGRPEEVANAVVFLLSSSSGYITGHNLVVDGGWTAW